MAKSHRSTLFNHHWPTPPPHEPPNPITITPPIPGSPSQVDPFGQSRAPPQQIKSRPSTVILPSSPLSTGSTPRIVLASPSTSTIHYLFPQSDTKSRLSSSDVPPAAVRRPSQRQPLGPAKRVVSGEQPRVEQPKSPVKSMRTVRRQPNGMGDGKGELLVEIGRKSFSTENRTSRPLEITIPKPLEDRSNLAKEPGPDARQMRRRSRSLGSIPPTSPSERASPILPQPDFGDPLCLSDVLPSPSFSHLDYSTAGSAAPSRRSIAATSMFSKHAPGVIYPVSAPMSRGDTRKGLGSYDAGKIKAREDAAKRLNGEGFMATLKRSVSLKKNANMVKKDSITAEKKPRPRSQSLSIRSTRIADAASPPVPPIRYQSGYPGDLTIDLGSRYTSFTTSSPRSIDTSIYPHSSPSSGYVSLAPSESRAVRYQEKPHPALASEVSVLATSSSSAASTANTPSSLPESLQAQLVDLTGSTPKPKRKSQLLAQNTFYLPPTHPKPSLRSTKSLGPGQLRRAFTSVSLSKAARSPDVEKPSLFSSKSKVSLKLQSPAQSPIEPAPLSPTTPSFRAKRPNTTFSLCSPVDAIEALPQGSTTEPIKPTKSTRSFLTASSSIRVMFGKDGFMARSLNQVFEKEHPGKAESEMKSKISSPITGAMGTTRSRKGKEATNADRDDKAWRENVLSQAVSMSFNTLSKSGQASQNTSSKMVSSGSKNRLGIPSQLLSAAPVIVETPSTPCPQLEPMAPSGSSDFAGIGQAMLKANHTHSIDSGLNLKEVSMDKFVPPPDAPSLPGQAVSAIKSRKLVQIGKEESSRSDSVYSGDASTARESPKTRNAATLDISRWSPSPVKRGKKADPNVTPQSQIVPARPVISPPLPLFTATDAAGINLNSLELPRPAPLLPNTNSIISQPMPLDSATSSNATMSTPQLVPPQSPISATIKTSPSRTGRMMNLLRSGDKSSPKLSEAATPPLPSRGLTSPSTFSLSLLRSPKSPKRKLLDNPLLKPVSSDSLPPIWPVLDGLSARDDAVAEPCTCKTAMSRMSGSTGTRGSANGGVLSVLVQDELHPQYHHRTHLTHEIDKVDGKAKTILDHEAKLQKVLQWREGVDESERMREMEEKWKRHVLEEKRTLRSIVAQGGGKAADAGISTAQP